MATNISKDKFLDIIKREEALRDGSPEHTLDWYTYDNRVTLLKEVKSLLHDVKPAKDEAAKVVKDKIPTAEEVKQVIEAKETKVENSTKESK